MSQAVVEQQANIATVLPEFFKNIADLFIPSEKHSEYFSYIDQQVKKAPLLFNPDAIRSARKAYKEQHKIAARAKKEAALPFRIETFTKQLKESVVERHTFIESVEYFTEPAGDISTTVNSLKQHLKYEKQSHLLSVTCKIFIGKHANHILSLCENNKADFTYLLKHHNINFSRTELSFAMKLAKLADKYQTLCRVSLPIRLLKTNLSILEQCLSQDEGFWNN